LIIDFSALAVRPARRWIARLGFDGFYGNLRLVMKLMKWIANYKWISFKALVAAAHWHVVNNLASCILSARSRARIFAFLSDTSLFSWAVLAVNTLRSAALVRISVIFWNASAHSISAVSI
jgi:hypothetical protein